MAVKQLRDAEAKVRALLEAESSAVSNVALPVQGRMAAAQHLERPERAEGAAASLTTIRQVAKNLASNSPQGSSREARQRGPDSAEREAVKAAERAVRDVVVWRCLCRVNPRDRKEFLAALQAAFGVNELDTDLQAQLLLSHRKIASSVIDSFPSNGQRATLWRGAPRPRPPASAAGAAGSHPI